MKNYDSPLNTDYKAKYDDKPRLELVQMIGQEPGRLLEIGCGAGATGALIKEKFPGTEYVGLELDAEAARRAESRLDRVIVADLEKTDPAELGLEQSYFDWLICADVLEHLYDPWKLLFLLGAYLKPEGKILASIPNIQNIRVIHDLVHGSWTYTDFGLLDATHLRFFTLQEIFKLFVGTGYRITGVTPTLQFHVEEEGWPKDIELDRITLKNVTREEAMRLSAFQYLVMAEKREGESVVKQ